MEYASHFVIHMRLNTINSFFEYTVLSGCFVKLTKLSRCDIARISKYRDVEMAHQQSRHRQKPHRMPHQSDEEADVECGYVGDVPQGGNIWQNMPTLSGKFIFNNIMHTSICYTPQYRYISLPL